MLLCCKGSQSVFLNLGGFSQEVKMISSQCREIVFHYLVQTNSCKSTWKCENVQHLTVSAGHDLMLKLKLQFSSKKIWQFILSLTKIFPTHLRISSSRDVILCRVCQDGFWKMCSEAIWHVNRAETIPGWANICFAVMPKLHNLLTLLILQKMYLGFRLKKYRVTVK